jgi:mono/diheme cytochrome c family protein
VGAAAVVDAGGWAVITVLHLPDYVVVGRPVTLTYAVRQHGRRLLDHLEGRLVMRLGAHAIYAFASRSSRSGHYSATFTLPYPGDWTVDIESGFSEGVGTTQLRLEAIGAAAAAPIVTDVERGRRLFNGKGCIACHTHGAVGRGNVNVGPELTARRYLPSYLRQFLAHPTDTPSAKSGSEMPDLDLFETEIASLIAFINGE